MSQSVFEKKNGTSREHFSSCYDGSKLLYYGSKQRHHGSKQCYYGVYKRHTLHLLPHARHPRRIKGTYILFAGDVEAIQDILRVLVVLV